MSPLALRFQTYVQQLTGQIPTWVTETTAPLPAFLSQRYEPRVVDVAGRRWLAALLCQPDPPAPLQLQKHLQQMAHSLALAPAGTCLVAEHLSPYLRNRLIELGQAFVIPGRQLFWPALGSAETTQRPRRLPPRPMQDLSPVTQQVLIALLLRQLPPPITISDTAEALGCTAAGISQAVRVLEGCALVRSEARGRERNFELQDAPRETWKRAQSLLRNPIRRRIRVREAELPSALTMRAGESALAERGDLGAPDEPMYAVASRTWLEDPARPETLPMPDAGTCVIELWRYPPQVTGRHGSVDPLSLYLSLRDSEDERVQLALQHLMDQQSW